MDEAPDEEPTDEETVVTYDEDSSILVVGNPMDGIFFHGPFPYPEEATEYGERHYRNDTWWVTTCYAPTKEHG